MSRSAQAAKQAQPERNPERWHVLEFYDATYPFRARTVKMTVLGHQP